MLDAFGTINVVGFLASILACVVAFSLDDPFRRLAPVKFGLLLTALVSGLEVLAGTLLRSQAATVGPILDASHLVVSTAWIGILQYLAARGFALERLESKLEQRLFVGCAAAYAVAIVTRATGYEHGEQWSVWDTQLRPITLVLSSIAGLIFCENIYRNAIESFRWRLKYLNFAVVMLLLFDLSVGIYEALQRMHADLFRARSLVLAMALPLILFACTRLTRPLSQYAVSREFVFHSTAAVLGGAYLLLVAIAAYYTKIFESSLTVPLQISVVLAGLAGLLAVLSSGSLKARIRAALARAFYDLKYDYRTEWLRFIATISEEGGSTSLQQRLIKSVADILESTGGGLWEWDETAGLFVHTAEWNYADSLGRNVAEPPWIERLKAGEILTAEAIVPASGDTQGIHLPDAWLVLPLPHGEGLSGFIVLRRGRASAQLDVEDHTLLRTMVRQIASYLAEYRATIALAEQREVKEFSDRVTFVVHDIKSIIGQLSLMIENAKRVGDDPEFRKDMLLTIADSVNGMRKMLLQLRQGHKEPQNPIELKRLIEQIIQPFRDGKADIELDYPTAGIRLVASRPAVESIIRQVAANAVEAAGRTGKVRIVVRARDALTTISVQDDGPGMDPVFVREQLFRPLHSNKPAGYGVGMYQVRELLRGMGGRIRVQSAVGAGTTVELILPSESGS